MERKFNRYRFVFRWRVRIRREGGSLSLTIPRYLVRRMQLSAGEDLIARLTEDGLLFRPVYWKPAAREPE